MKYFNWHQRSFLLFVLVLIFAYSCKKEEIKPSEINTGPQTFTSTINGGDWSSPSTWIENLVPNEKSDVVISGRVNIKSKVICLNLMIDNGAILEVEKDASIKIIHHLINEGIIINNGTIGLKENKK